MLCFKNHTPHILQKAKFSQKQQFKWEAQCLAWFHSSESGLKNTKWQVMVMKDDRVIHCFKKGSHVKDVLVSHPAYQIIKSNSETTLLPESFQLSCNQLYFLLPKGASLNDKSINNALLRIAECRDPSIFVFSSKGDNTNGFGNLNADTGPDNDEGYSEINKRQMIISSQRKPSLQTIPEVSLSTILQSDASAW